MAYVLTLPVQHSELVNVMISRSGLESMTEPERAEAVERIRITASTALLLVPDYFRERRVRM